MTNCIPSRLFVAFLAALSLLDPGSISAGAESDGPMVTPNLPLGDINVVILTDVHSWLGSHRRQEPYYDADLGDVLSFWEDLKAQCDDRDIFFVNNGDFVDGTGLSETMGGENDPEYLIPLLEKMPYDAVNVGNHELYSKKNIEYMTRPGGYVDWWGDRYLSSNIKNLGNHYKVLHGNNSNLLVFGFLYNMRGYATGAGIEVEKVEKTVKQQWFSDALLEEDYDAILVLAHMDLVDPIVEVLRSAMRDVVGEGTPILFATGHTHYRGVKQLEDLTMTFEAGRFLDTVGFVSLPKKESVARIKSEKASTSDLFGHVFLDTNRKVLFEDTLGFTHAEDGITKNGRDFSEFIDHTRQKLGLDDEIGCAPHSFFVNRYIDAPDSLWGLYRDQVVPKIFKGDRVMKAIEDEVTDDDLPSAMLLPKGNWRYDLYTNSSLVVDDVYTIAPFNDTVVHMGIFSSDVLLEANQTLNKHSYGKLPDYILVGDLVGSSATDSSGGTRYHLYTHEFDAKQLQSALKKLAPSETVEIRKTEITSSLIWMAFIQKYWPCNGTVGELPSWFPTHPKDDSNRHPKIGDASIQRNLRRNTQK